MASNTIRDNGDDSINLEDNNPDIGSSSDINQQYEGEFMTYLNCIR